MDNMKIQTLKGFRDFLPKDARKRQYVIRQLAEVFESYGFEPLETPALEYAEILKGKYGEEEKLIYEFETKGKDKVALRYDQTVPLSRVVSQYQNELVFPFKRYQIQNVWRGENTQKGRYREFIQCDADIVGTASPISDAEILKLVLDIYSALKLDVTVKINDRKNFENLDKKYVLAIDKLEKIGESGVLSEMTDKGLSDEDAKRALKALQEKPQTETIIKILSELKLLGADMNKIAYEPTLARGLDYYTGLIFETVAQGSSGSICSGGRYDNLIGMFSQKQIPAVGFGLGFDRTIEVLETQNKLPQDLATAKVLVTIFSPDLKKQSIDIISMLRSEKVNCELYLDENTALDKQLKYADRKGIPYAIIIGPEEAKSNSVTLKNLKSGEQKRIAPEQIKEAVTI
ncbi:MAG: histidine--tRNA ligase [Patescibacteria group bacterium]|nr:histidine--tRNA ligase [Patescibacteria group bacterium]